MSSVTFLASRRVSTNGELGFEYVCGICDTTIFTAIRFDHFPSCLSCRALCSLSYTPKPLIDVQRGKQDR